MTHSERKLIILARNHDLVVGDDTEKRILVPMLEKIADEQDFPIKDTTESFNLENRIYTMSNQEKKFILLKKGYTHDKDYKVNDENIRQFLTLDDFPIKIKTWSELWRESSPQDKLYLVSELRLDKLLDRKELGLTDGLTRLEKISLLTELVDEFDF